LTSVETPEGRIVVDKQAWDEMLVDLTEQLGPGTVRILQSSEVTLEGDTLTYTVSYPPIVEKNDRHLVIKAAVQAILGAHVEVVYEKKTAPLEEAMASLGVSPSPRLVEQIRQPITIPLGFGWTELSQKHNGDSFCRVSFNNSAHAAALDLINGHKTTACLIGPPGTGKTHLGQWILHQLEARGKRVAYVPVKKFRDNAVHAARNRTPDLEFYVRGFDGVFFDDIHFWRTHSSPGSFDHFVQVLAALMGKEVTLILAMHDWPRTYGFPAEMTDRLHEGGLAKIHEPTDEDRLELVRFRAKDYPNITDRIITEMVSTPRNLRDYVGALDDLSREIRLGDIPSSITSWMNERYGGVDAVELTVENIILAVEEAVGLKPGKILGTGQIKDQARGRHIAWYLMEELLHMKQTAIAKLFGGMCPSSVSTAIKKIRASSDPIVPANINEAKRLLGLRVE